MSAECIIEGIKTQDREFENLPHPVRKVKAVEYVLKNTRIACDTRDIFPAINMIDRPLDRTIVSNWDRETNEEIVSRHSILLPSQENTI